MFLIGFPWFSPSTTSPVACNVPALGFLCTTLFLLLGSWSSWILLLCLCLAHVPCRCFTPGSHGCWTGYPTLENPPPGLTTLMASTAMRRRLSTLVSLARDYLLLVTGIVHRSPLRPFQLVAFRTNLHQVLHWHHDYTSLPFLRPTFAIYSTRARSCSYQDFGSLATLP